MGVAKAFIAFEGRMLIEHVIDTLRRVCDPIIIVANDRDAYARFGLPVVPDSVPDFGPLAGLHAGLTAARSEVSVVVAVDMPFLDPGLLRAMIQAADGWDAVIPALSAEVEAETLRQKRAKDLDLHPLHAVYRRACLPSIQAAIERGDRKVNSFFPDIRLRCFTADEMRVYDPELRSLVNINTPNELHHARRLRP